MGEGEMRDRFSLESSGSKPGVFIMGGLAVLFLWFIAACASADEPTSPVLAPDYAEDFEINLDRWEKGAPDKNPLVIVNDRSHHGRRCASSGPPDAMNVSRFYFPVPLVGRLEVWFYDDMAPAKHQIAAANSPEDEFLGIVCAGGNKYKVRVGKDYTEAPVERSEGWRQFAWECDGEKTTAFIDGAEVFANPNLGTIGSIALGSFWDDSTGWWDDLRAYIKPPSSAYAFVEAERAFRQKSPESSSIEIAAHAGASGKAIKRWDKPGQELEWALASENEGKHLLLFKYALAAPFAKRKLEFAGLDQKCNFLSTGSWDAWDFFTVPVTVKKGTHVLRMTALENPLNLDWIALVPEYISPKTYGKKLDRWLLLNQWTTAAVKQISEWAEREGIDPPRITDWIHSEKLPSEEELKKTLEQGSDNLYAVIGKILEPRKNLLISTWRVRPFLGIGHETPLSQEYYRRLLRYVRYTSPQFKTWPYAKGCKFHKRDDHLEHGIRQNAVVAFAYSTLLLGTGNKDIAGVSRSSIEQDLVELLRYLTITHKANFLPTGDGQPWGDHWQSAHWANFAGQAAWQVWERLPDDVKLMTIRMLIHEADRFNERPPDSGVLFDTKAEENAWNSQVIALAACMLPNHPRNALWHERANVWMINSLVREMDRGDTRIVDGKPARDRLQVVTIHPDYTLENHGRVHPDYMACGYLMVRNAHLYRAAQVPVPDSCFYNVPETFDILYHLTATNGSFFYINGQDWTPHRHDTCLVMWGCMNTLKRDPRAAFLERATLAFLERMHTPFENGTVYDPRTYIYPNPEEEMMARYAEMYIHHRMYGDGPEPVTREEFLKRESLTKVFDIGGFVTHRTPTKFASFAWKNGAMGLVFPSDDTWFTSPSERGMVGRIRCADAEDTRPNVTLHKIKTGEGFSFSARIERCQGKIEQWMAMASLPGDTALYLERLVTRDNLNIQEVATGMAGIFNEDAPGIIPNYRILHTAEGQEKIVGASKKPEEIKIYNTSWANVDGKMGFVTSNARLAYHDNNIYRAGRLEEELIGNYLENVGQAAPDREISAFAMLFLPNQSPEKTALTILALEQPALYVLAARFEGKIVMANLGPDSREFILSGQKYALDSLETMIIDQAQK